MKNTFVTHRKRINLYIRITINEKPHTFLFTPYPLTIIIPFKHFCYLCTLIFLKYKIYGIGRTGKTQFWRV